MASLGASQTMKYFFHLEDGTCIRDPNGQEFPNDASALIEATAVAVQLSLEVHAPEWRVVVKNADGLRVGAVPILPDRTEPAQGTVMPPSSVH
jgi:hypothetical protein